MSESSGRAKSIAGLLFLCVLWSLNSLRGDMAPSLVTHALTGYVHAAVALGLLALLAAIFAVPSKVQWPRGRRVWACAGIGLGLFFVPELLLSLAQGSVPELERVAVFSLTPVFAIVLEPHLSAIAMPIRGALLAALVAVAGALTLFPLNPPVSTAALGKLIAVIAAALCIAAANCMAVRVINAEPRPSLSAFIAVTAAPAAIACATAAVLESRAQGTGSLVTAELAWIVLVDLPSLWVLFWLFKRITAARMTVRFVLAPAITAGVAVAIEQPVLQLRTIVGLVLLAGGAVWLLLAREETAESGVFGLE